MPALIDKIAPRTVLDEIAEGVLCLVLAYRRSRGLPPSATVVRRMIRCLALDELHRRTVDLKEARDTLDRLADALPMVRDGTAILPDANKFYWRLLNVRPSASHERAPELVAVAAILVTEAVWAELHGH